MTDPRPPQLTNAEGASRQVNSPPNDRCAPLPVPLDCPHEIIRPDKAEEVRGKLRAGGVGPGWQGIPSRPESER